MKGSLMKNVPLFLAGVAPVFIFQLYYESGIQRVTYGLFQLWAKATLLLGLIPSAIKNTKRLRSILWDERKIPNDQD